MTTVSPEVELRTALIAALKADAGVKATALGASPRIFNVAPPASDPRAKLPILVVQEGEAAAFDTDTTRGLEFSVQIFVMGERMGHDEGQAIFQACRVALRDWAPALSAHSLANLIFQGQGIASEEDGKRYFGRQRWRARTEELS